MPALDLRLHYRLVDVSTLKELARGGGGRRWYPERSRYRRQERQPTRLQGEITESR